MKEKITLDFNNSKLNVENRSKGRMKITIKLNKESAESVKNFMEAIKPPEVPDEQFYTHVFFTGLEALNAEIKRMFEEQKGKLEEQKRLALSAESILTPVVTASKEEAPTNVIQGSFGTKVN